MRCVLIKIAPQGVVAVAGQLIGVGVLKGDADISVLLGWSTSGQPDTDQRQNRSSIFRIPRISLPASPLLLTLTSIPLYLIEHNHLDMVLFSVVYSPTTATTPPQPQRHEQYLKIKNSIFVKDENLNDNNEYRCLF